MHLFKGGRPLWSYASSPSLWPSTPWLCTTPTGWPVGMPFAHTETMFQSPSRKNPMVNRWSVRKAMKHYVNTSYILCGVVARKAITGLSCIFFFFAGLSAASSSWITMILYYCFVTIWLWRKHLVSRFWQPMTAVFCMNLVSRFWLPTTAVFCMQRAHTPHKESGSITWGVVACEELYS